MARLPRFTAETPPPRETGLVRARDIPSLTRSGAAAVWRGVSRVGEAMMGAAGLGFSALERRKKLDDVIQWGNATQKVQEIISEKEYEAERTDFKMDMPQLGDIDYERTLVENSAQKRTEYLDTAMKDVDERVRKVPQGFTNRQKAKEFEVWYAGRAGELTRNLKHIVNKKLDSFQRAGMNKLSEDAAQNGDIETANYYIEIMDKFELITPESAAIKKVQVEKIAAKAALDFAKVQIETEVRQLAVADNDWESAYQHLLKPKNQQEWAKAYGVPLAEVKEITLDVKTMFDGERRLANEELVKQRETDRAEIYDAIADSTITREMIEGTSLSEKEQQSIWELARNEKIREYSTDPNTEARILRDLSDPESKITQKDILDLVGKPEGLSIDTARRFIADLEFWQDPWFKRSDMFFKSQLGWDGAYEKWMHPEGGLTYKLASDELFNAIETEKLRGKDIYDRGTQIAIPYFIDYWEKVLKKEKPEIERLTALLEGEIEGEPETKKPTKPKEREKVKSKIDPAGIW